MVQRLTYLFDGDPRDFLPVEVAEKITDAAIEEWRLNYACLCGCGRPCSPRTRPYNGIPKGSMGFFKAAHMWRLHVGNRLTNEEVRRANIRRRMGEISQIRSISTLGLSFVLDEYLRTSGEQVRDLSERIGVNRGYLSTIRTYKVKRIRKETFARIMAGIGEPIPWGYGQYVPDGIEFTIARGGGEDDERGTAA